MSATPRFESKGDEVVFEALRRWYDECPARLQLLQAFNTRSDRSEVGTSLRNIDYAIVNFAKKTGACTSPPGGSPFDIYTEYKNLSSKKNMDPFRRTMTFRFRGVKTCLCQMNFFRWIIERGILDWILRNLRAISVDKSRVHRERKLERRKNKRHYKKKELNKRTPFKCSIFVQRSSRFEGSSATSYSGSKFRSRDFTKATGELSHLENLLKQSHLHTLHEK